MPFNLNRKRKRLIILLLVLAFIIYFFYLVRSVLTPFILAIILAYLLNPIISTFEKRGFNKNFAIFLTYFSFIFLTSVTAYYGFPIIIKEINAFTNSIPEYTVQIQKIIRDFYTDFQRVEIPESVRQVTNENVNNLEQILLDTLDKIASGIWGVFSSLFSIILAPILTFYILKDSNKIGERVLQIFSTSIRDEIKELWYDIDWVLTKFIRGHLLVASLVGAITALGLSLINVKFAVLLGIIAGLADIIPYFGPILGALPAIFVALLDSKVKALYVIIVMFIIQQLESNFISPRILGESVGLHPVVVIFTLMAGGSLFGVLGLLLAVPVTAVARIIINYIYIKMLS